MGANQLHDSTNLKSGEAEALTDEFSLSPDWIDHIFENKAAGIFILDTAGDFKKVNKAFLELTGYTREELDTLSILDLTPAEDIERFSKNAARILSGELESLVQHRKMLTKSSGYRWIEVSASVIREDNLYLLCFVKDIHEQKLAMEQLRIKEEQLHQAQDVAKIGSWGMDLRTGEIQWSQGMYDLMELPYDFQPTIEKILEYIHPDDRDQFIEKLAGQKEVKNLEIRHLTVSGVKHVLVNSRIEYENEFPIRYHGTSQDISDSRFVEKRLELVQEIARLGWWEANLVTDEDDIWSDSMYELLGLRKGKDRPCFDTFFTTIHPEDRDKVLGAMSSDEQMRKGWHNKETRHKLPDGTYGYFLSSGHFVWNGDRPVKLIGTMKDISRMKETSTLLEEAQKIARLGLWEVDLTTREVLCSDTTYDIMGVDRRDGPLPFDQYVERVHPDDRAWLYTDLQELKEGWVNKELRYLKESGGYTYVLTSGRVIFNGDKPIKIIGTNMDITSLKETQLKLEQAQQIAKMGWWEFDLTGKGDHKYSPEQMEIFEISSEKDISTLDDFYDLIHPDDLELVKQSLQTALKKGEWNGLVNRIRCKKGGYKYITSNARVDFQKGKPSRLFGTVYDVTDFRETQQRLEVAQKVAKMGWWEYDMTGEGDHMFSTEYLGIMEVSSVSEIDSFETFIARVHPEERDFVLEKFKEALKNREWHNLIYRVRQRNGGYKYIATHGNVECMNDEPRRIIGCAYDITDLKHAEEELSKNLVNLEAMVNSMENIVFVIDDQLRFREVFCNDPDKLDRKPDEFLGRKVGEIWKGDSSKGFLTEQLCRDALLKKSIDNKIYRFGPEGQELWWEASFRTFVSQDGKQWLTVIINDITAKKKAEEETLKSIRKEKELSEMRSQFVAMASHQFRTPLSVISFNMQLLELSEPDAHVVGKVVRRTKSEIERLVTLMDDIMAMGKVQSNALEPKLKPVNPVALIKRIKLNVEAQQADDRQLKINVSGKEKALNLDEELIEHALTNLIENAFKYSPDAKDPEVNLVFKPEKIRLSIVDYGLGISEEDHAKLFSPFYRGQNTEHITGTGLGLAVAREFIQLSGGTIFLNKRRKTGTEFCVDLPVL